MSHPRGVAIFRMRAPLQKNLAGAEHVLRQDHDLRRSLNELEHSGNVEGRAPGQATGSRPECNFRPPNSEPDTALYCIPVARLRTWMVAPANGAPSGSAIVPLMVPDALCANAADAVRNAIRALGTI